MTLNITTILITVLATTTPSMTLKCKTQHNIRMSVTMLNAIMVRAL